MARDRFPSVRTLLLAALLACPAPAPAEPAGFACALVVSVAGNGPVGSLGWTLDYSGADGEIQGSGTSPSCTSLVSGSLSAFTDFDAKKLLKGGFVSASAVSTPRDLASCVFLSPGLPASADFDLALDDAADDDGVTLNPAPEVTVSSVDCEVVTTTTTTTLPPPLCQDWTATFMLDSASAPVAGIQFEVDYGESGGYFAGNGADVDCVSLLGQGNFASQDEPADSTLSLALVTLSAVQAPVPLAKCTFRASSSTIPDPGDFVLSILDASDVDVQPVEVAVSVTLEAAGAVALCASECGDGYVDGDEECDDGDASSQNGCLNDCRIAACGDALVRNGVEQCDDGNDVDTDACRNDCKSAVCGDGVVRDGVEQCDDGDLSNADACLANCREARCGDGAVRSGVEQCDDGNLVDTDACRNSCVAATCGDGVRRPATEACDDGNASNTDGCVGDCKPASCGDGFVRAGVEACDDGNTSNTDGCVGSCKLASCGDGFVRAGVEECDSGAPQGSRGCSSQCRVQPSCADPTNDGRVTVADALRVIQRAVDLDVDCPDWSCDANDDGKVSVSDGLLALQESVHLPVTLKCREPAWLVLRMTTPAPLGALGVVVDYPDAQASVPGTGDAVQCQGLVPGAIFAFNRQGSTSLRVSMVSLDGVTSPRNIARCVLVPSGPVRPADFAVTILDAASPATLPVAGVQVKAIPY